MMDESRMNAMEELARAKQERAERGLGQPTKPAGKEVPVGMLVVLWAVVLLVGLELYWLFAG